MDGCGALEPKFHTTLFKVLGIEQTLADFSDPEALIAEMEAIFAGKTQDEWVEIFKDADACVTPVLDLKQVGTLNHHLSRHSFDRIANKYVPGQHPKFIHINSFLC
uniref:Uncharacterized protein n=1 Tax=Ditylenchus dipsaci TaxID=166011 RepID=A0A915EU77_9BILA